MSKGLTASTSMIWWLLSLAFVNLYLLDLEQALGLTSGMVPINTQCACPGDIIIYTCTAVGGGTTLWGGTAFKCGRLNEIALRHSLFASGRINGTCSNGAIVGQSIGVQDNCYISQLNITVGAKINNKTVNCVHDSIYSNSTMTIGKALLRVISVANPYPPPSDISLNLDKIHLEVLTFNWTSTKFLCSSKPVEYTITSDGGICPISTNTSVVSCAGVHVSTEPATCSFRITSMVCNIRGTVSAPWIVNLKVPDAPKLSIVPIYSGKNQTLEQLSITITINQTANSFLVSDSISGNITHFIYVFYSSNVNVINFKFMHLVTVQSLSCEKSDNICKLNVDVPYCPSSTNISVAISAANRLGEGPPSDAIVIGCTNEIVRINFTSTTSTICCVFLNVSDNSEKSCSVMYGLCHQQLLTLTAQGNSSDENTVSFTLSDIYSKQQYHYSKSQWNFIQRQ